MMSQAGITDWYGLAFSDPGPMFASSQKWDKLDLNVIFYSPHREKLQIDRRNAFSTEL